jgi:hypothetical protein
LPLVFLGLYNLFNTEELRKKIFKKYISISNSYNRSNTYTYSNYNVHSHICFYICINKCKKIKR